MNKPELETKVVLDEKTANDRYGRFIVEPLDRGYGQTMGNALRRVLLSSIPGAAITAVRIKGATNEFATLTGVKEDVVHILMNLKSVRLKCFSDERQILRLKVKKGGEVFARDIETTESVEIVNPDVYIATLSPGAELDMEMEVNTGMGYVLAADNKYPGAPATTIFVDSLFSPIVRVNYEVTNTRVGQITDYDKLSLEIFTDGSVSPRQALVYSVQKLLDLFKILLPEKNEQPAAAPSGVNGDILQQPIDILGLPIRAWNALKAHKINQVGELIALSEDELLVMKNFGEKSMETVKKKLAEYNLSLKSTEPAPAPEKKEEKKNSKKTKSKNKD